MTGNNQVDAATRVRKLLDGPRPFRVVQEGDRVLRTPAEPFSDQLPAALLAELLDAMRAHLPGVGVGIAAPQLGIPLAIAVIEDAANVSAEDAAERQRYPQPLLELINPTVTPVGDEVVAHSEGCLSIEGASGLVARYRRVRLDATDRFANNYSVELTGWPARIAQHETDHLNGVLYVDRTDPRSLVRRS